MRHRFGWPQGDTLIGAALNFTPVDPIKALFWERGHQRRRGSPDHCHDHVGGVPSEGDAPVYAQPLAQGARMGGYSGRQSAYSQPGATEGSLHGLGAIETVPAFAQAELTSVFDQEPAKVAWRKTSLEKDKQCAFW
jgi:hypothetical protein